MKEFDCDLHFHSPYAGGVSKNMLMPLIAEQAKLKGLDVVVTSDILHKEWLKHVKEQLIEENNVYRHKKFNTAFIVGTEICCKDRVHHLIYFPSLEAAEELKEKFKGHGNMDSFGCGRPIIRLSAEKIAEEVYNVGGILGPAHSFTPYFSIYAHFNSFKELYGEFHEKISFMELGLSADTFFADLIQENHSKIFLTCSDSHSPWPHRVGREFTRIKMQKPSFKELKKALEFDKERKPVLNIGLDPREGKYHCSACNACFTKYSFADAVKLNWKCIKPNCRGQIVKGVRDRIMELSSFKEEIHPESRPEYIHILPLAEIIQLTLNLKNVQAKKVQEIWTQFIDSFESEIKILIDVPVNELSAINEAVAKKINAFRQGLVLYIPGGGGKYGQPFICDSKQEFEEKQIELGAKLYCKTEEEQQKKLFEY